MSNKITVAQAVNTEPILIALEASRDMGAEGYKIGCLHRKSIKTEVEKYHEKWNESIQALGEESFEEVKDKDGKLTGEKKSLGVSIKDPEKLKEHVKLMNEIGAVEIELPTAPCATLDRIEKAKITLSYQGGVILDNECLNGTELAMIEYLFKQDEPVEDR